LGNVTSSAIKSTYLNRVFVLCDSLFRRCVFTLVLDFGLSVANVDHE